MNSHINNNTTTPNYLRILQTLPSYTNGNFTYLDNNYAYVIFNSNSSIQFKEDTPCELLIVGAGGRGGAFSTFGGAGGGGCGQVIYNSPLTFQSKSYDIIIGIDSADSNQRISKIISNNEEFISAMGGGDGAYWDGLSFGEIQRYPPEIFTSNSPIIKTTFLNNPCYKSTIYVNSNSYDVFYSSRKENSSFDAINLFNCLEPSSNNEAVFLNNQYNNSQKLNYKQSNFLVDFTYKGDWVCIKLPIPILLTSYSFFQNTTEIGGAPNNFKIYGSVNGIDWDVVKERNSLVNLSISYLNNKYTETLSPLPTKPYLYYGLVVNSLIGSLTYLNFNEWVLNGKPIIITSPTMNGGSSIFNLPSNQIQGDFGGSYLNQNLIKTINENSSINIPYDNHFFKINRNPLNTYINSGTYSAIFNEGFITFANETFLSFPILTSIEPEYWYKFNSSSGFNDNLIISGNITKNLNDIYFEYGAYLTPTINQLWNSYGISFSFWIKPEIDIGDNIWIFKTIENSNEFISFHKNEFKISNNGLITSVNFNINILDGSYHHFICSINPSGRIFVACDGIIYENYSINPFVNNSYIDGRIGEFFQGYIKDFRIYLKVLDIDQIQELFKGRIEIFYNRFNENITTTNIQMGSGGIGGTASSIPTIKNFYGDGGDGNRDGNLGLGFQGIVIIKYPYPYFNTTITPYKFPNSQFLKFSGLNNPDGIAFKLLENKDDNRILSINDLNFHITSNDPYIESIYNIDINNSLFINSYNTIGFGTNIGINNSFSINDFTIKNNSNISFINPDGFFGIGTTNPLEFMDIRNDVFMSKLNINSLEIKIINSNQNSLIIPENSRIYFNYTNETKINSGIYDINFIDGSIIFGYLNPDKSYPILKEIYSIEREYPPKLYDIFTTEITSSGEILNVNPLNYIKETITLNSTNINYGSGIYKIYSSGTTNDIARTKARLFNKNIIYSFSDIGAYWGYNNYNTINGTQRNNKYIKNDYYGEWSIIKFPFSFILTKYIISIQTNNLFRAPSLIRFYGSIDGIIWNVIQEAEISTPLTSNDYSSSGIYEKILNNTFNISYLYIGFTINKIIGDPLGSNYTPLAIAELQLFGKEIEDTIINPIAWYKFDDITNLEKDELNNFNLISVNNPTSNSTIFNKGIGSLSLSRQNNQYLILNYLDFNDLSFSISLWSYLLSYDNDFTPLFYKGTDNEIFIIAYSSNRTIVFGFNDNNLSAGNFPNDTNIWINWIFTYDKDTKNRKIYRNGLIIAEDFSSSLYTPIIHIYNIGRLIQNNIENYFDGYIDDFRIYNKVLNANQVQELYKGRIEIHSYLNTNNNLNVYGNASISGDADIGNLILNGVIYKSNGIPFIDSGWTTMSEANSNIFNSYSVVGIGTTFPRFQNRLDVNGSIVCNEVYVNGSLLTSDFIKNSGTTAETIALGTLRKSSGGTGVNSFASNQILNSTIIWSNNSLNIPGNLNNSNNVNERIVLNNGIMIGNVIIDKYGISNSHINSNIIIGNSNKFLIRSNIGIGTTNPINALDIRGNMGIRRVLGVSNISNNEILNGIVMNVSNISIENSGVINKYLSRWGNSNNFMGFVGIGTTNPRNSLDIIGNVGIKGVLNVSNISNNEIFNGITMNVSNINIENSVINYKNNSSFIGSRWNLSNSSIVYNSGFVGIRTNVLDSNLNINGNFDMKGFLDMNNSNISNIDWFGGKTLKINNLNFLTNSSTNINFINGNTLNLNNWTTNNSNSTKYVQTFSYTGGIQTFNIPLGVNSINIYCWGAGGGAGDTTLGNTTGGDGGFVKATLDVSSISSLKLIVGQGGRVGIISGKTTTAFGGGGFGRAADANYAPGSGGGLSGIFIDNANFYMTGDNNNFVNNTATAIIIAGAGGGNGNRADAGNEDTLFNGGNGGSDIANDGSTITDYPQNGKGGTQITGGLAGTGNIANGNNGNKYSGGNANATSYGGGGGSGWYGGGAGGVSGSRVGCGGGGSSYVNTSSYYITNITNLKTINNNSRSPPGTTEIYYQTGIAVGASPANNGGNGLIVIEYYISNTYYNYGNVGIKTSINQSNSLDINGDLNFYSNISNLNNQIFNFENYNGLISMSAPLVSFTNNPINNSYGFYQFNISKTITFNRDLLCDVLVVGAGGNGGVSAGSGGGGAGEVIYQPNYLFQKGSYDLSVGTSSTSTGNRVSKIMKGTTEIFKALGGGDGNILNNSITITGTGNSINIASDNPNYRYAYFANNGTFIIDNDLECEILIVGGGGGGGRNDGMEGGGGGGAGAVGLGSIYLRKNITYNITIGNGGNGAASHGNGANGTDTTIIGDLISERAYGGGGGGWQTGANGGSGGGGSGHGGSYNGGSATKGISSSGINTSIIYYGNNGGYGYWQSGGSGGGGANNTGNTTGAMNRMNGANGGNGIQTSILGISTYYGGGGGGAFGEGGSSVGLGGLGGGGNGGNRGSPASGSANTGGGGGGSSGSGAANGGSGILIIRYLINLYTSGGNQLISKNSSIITRNLSLIVNYTNNIFLSSGNYDINFNNGNIGFGESPYVKPWGAYFADDWSGTTLLDSSGNGRHATTSGTIAKTSGISNGATGAITYIYGDTTGTIRWPSGSIPTNFTILSLTRYNGATKRRLIVSAGTGNWLHGHYLGKRGLCHYDGWLTAEATTGTDTDWLCCIGKNGGTYPNNVLIDGVAIGTATGGTGGYSMGVNNDQFGTTSDWALSAVIIYDSHLSNFHMNKLNNFINTYKSSGNITELKSNILRNIDNSYPILKDISGNNINPIVWYKFDGASTFLNDTYNTSNNLTNNGATYDTTNFIKGFGSVNFNYLSSQYLTIPSINLYNIQSLNGISFCLWFRMNTTNTGAYPRIFDFSNGNTTTPRWILISRYTSTDNRLNFDIANTANSSGNRITTNNYIDGNWHHIVWSINNLGSWVIYIDGVIASFTASLPTNINIENVNFTSNSLGKSLINGDGYYDGNIDDFRIYNFVLSQSHVQELYNGRVEINHSPFQNTIIKYSSGGSGGGSYYNSNNQSYTLAKWNNNYSYISSGNNGTNFIGGNGGSSLITSTYNLTGTNQIIGIGGVGATSASASGSKSYGCGGDGNGGSGGSGVIIIKILKELRNFNLARNYLFNNGTDYPILNGERQYPPKIWDTIDSSITDITYNGLISYKINYNITTSLYGNGSYSVYYSNKFILEGTYYNSPVNNLFDYSLENAGNFLDNSITGYNSSSDYTGDRYLAEQSFKGEWFFIKLPIQIMITRYIIIALPNYVHRSPALWKIYGSNDGINWEEIIQASNSINKLTLLDYTNNNKSYSKILNTPSKIYNHIGMCINAIISNMELNFSEFQIFGIEKNSDNIINPTAWYKFDNPSNVGFDSSGNGYHLTNNGNVSVVSGVKGTFASFFNATNYLSNTNGINFSGKSFSISYWQYATSNFNAFTCSFGDNLNKTLNNSLMVGYGTNHANKYFFGFWSNDYYSPEFPNDVNNWVFLTFTYNYFTGLRKVYRNCVYIGGDTSPSQLTLNGTSICIGKILNVDGYSTNGYFDDFRIYNEIELTQSQINELYENSRINFIINGNSISKGTNYISSTNNYPLLTYANSNIINPIIWYKFDDSTNIGKDEMNLLNLTNSSTPVTLNTTLFTKGISSCDIATTSFLKSTSANISLYFSQKSFSISFWVYMRSSTNGFTIAIGPSVSDGGIWFGYSVNSILNTYHFGCHNSGADLNSSAIYSDVNTWVYLTFTYNINNILRCIYRNGILIASNTRVASSFTTNVFWIGRITNDTSYSMNGIIDDFRIYDFELSSSQVQELYNTTNNYTTLINYPTNYFSSYSSNFNNPFIRTSNNNLELLSYTNNNVNSLLLESNIKLITNNNNRLTFNSNIISINNSLDIKGNSGTITNQGGAYFTTDVSSSSYSNGYIPEYTNYSLKTFDNIICGKNSYALSDMRIKKNVSNIDDVSSLEKILKVEPKIYGYIDNIQRTNSNVYGFIAQQIRDILPEATELTTKFIPDIFKLVKKNGNRINLNEEDLKKIEIRDILEIYTKDNSYEVKVITKDNDGIEIDRNIKDNDIFIYGRQVKDFHIIDKSYLYTLNICATQELARIIEGLKERINNL